MVIDVQNLTKEYGSETALDEVSFGAEKGDVLGFVGPNGAGKSTTINCMLGLEKPTNGSIKLFGDNIIDNPLSIKNKIGVVPEDYKLYDDRTGDEHIRMSARAKSVDANCDFITKKVGLNDSNKKVSGYSTGMKQRLILGMALVGEPELLILDEPGGGLDPNGIRTLQDIISSESDNGTTVFFSSHILSNIENVCNKVVIIDDGINEFFGTMSSLREKVSQQKELNVKYEGTIGNPDFGDVVEEYEIHKNDEITIIYNKKRKVHNILVELIDNLGIRITDISTSQDSLSELFGQMTEGDEE
jgi:ABC-2 type transport system ATP-binding protein